MDFLLKSSGQIKQIRNEPMGPQFFQTMMGRRFYESDVPRIAKALERIATELEKSNTPIVEIKEAKIGEAESTEIKIST